LDRELPRDVEEMLATAILHGRGARSCAAWAILLAPLISWHDVAMIANDAVHGRGAAADYASAAAAAGSHDRRVVVVHARGRVTR
jgi:hypothetical protein